MTQWHFFDLKYNECAAKTVSAEINSNYYTAHLMLTLPRLRLVKLDGRVPSALDLDLNSFDITR
jgi:hypothetical protein